MFILKRSCNILVISLTITFLVSGLSYGNAAFDLPQDMKEIMMKGVLERKYPLQGDINSYPEIERDLNAIVAENKINKEAIKRLRHQGKNAAPKIIARLRDNELSLLEKKVLISILAHSCALRSQEVVIEFSEYMRNLDPDVRKLSLKLYYSQTFRALGKCQDTLIAKKYADELLNDQSIDNSIHAQAIYFLANQNSNDSVKWLSLYNAHSDDPELMYALLYLGVMLNKDRYADKAKMFLITLREEQKYRYETRLLIELLADKLTVSNMQNFLESLRNKRSGYTSGEEVEKYRLLSKLYKGDNEQKAKAVKQMFSLGLIQNKFLVVRSTMNMITKNEAKPYIELWELKDIALIHVLKYLGYRIDVKNGIASFTILNEARTE